MNRNRDRVGAVGSTYHFGFKKKLCPGSKSDPYGRDSNSYVQSRLEDADNKPTGCPVRTVGLRLKRPISPMSPEVFYSLD